VGILRVVRKSFLVLIVLLGGAQVALAGELGHSSSARSRIGITIPERIEADLPLKVDSRFASGSRDPFQSGICLKTASPFEGITTIPPRSGISVVEHEGSECRYRLFITPKVREGGSGTDDDVNRVVVFALLDL